MPIGGGSGGAEALAFAAGLLVAFALTRFSVVSQLRSKKRSRSDDTPKHSDSDKLTEKEFEALNAANMRHFLRREDRRALVDSELHALVEAGAFQFHFTNPVPRPVDLHKYVQPASIDLPVTGSAFLVKEKVLPFHHRVVDLLHDLTLEKKRLAGDGVVLLKGQTYLVYCGTVDLPANMKGCLSPKSSIGRVDLLVRGVVDGIGLYDTIPGGSRRSLWLEVTPQSFNVRIKEGLALTQLMVFRGSDSTDTDDRNDNNTVVSLTSESPPPPPSLDAAIESGSKTASGTIEGQPLIFNSAGKPLVHQWENGALVLCLSVPDVSEDGAASTIVGYVV